MNKYLEKLAEIPVEEFVHTDELTPEQLEQIFLNFKLLPSDSPLGQPSTVTKFVRTKLRE